MVIAPSEAVRALYIDFEGGQNLPPSFIGIRTQENGVDLFEQVIVEQDLIRVLDLSNPTNHKWPSGYERVEQAPSQPVTPTRSASSFAAMVASLVARAEAEDRLLVSWSTRESKVITESNAIEDSIKQRFLARWRDAKAAAKVWKKAKHRKVRFERLVGRGRHRLDCYMTLIGYDLPSYFGDQQAAQRIAYVRRQLATRDSAAKLTPVAKAKWTKVLDYNWHDCNGMREVTLRAARELEG